MYTYIKILFFTIILSSNLFGQNDTKHILLINSYHQGMTWTDNITKEVIKKFSFPGSMYSLHIEYMDTKRIYNDEYLENLAKIYTQKYKNIKLELILSTDNNALDFLKKYRDTVFGNVPVVFSGVNNYTDEMLNGYQNYTGIEERTSTVETIKAMIKINPKLKTIYILNDYLKTGKALVESIKEDLKKEKFNIEFIFSEPLSIDELKEKISSFKDDTAVLLGFFYSDKNYVHVSQQFLKNNILNNSPVPIYTLAEYYIGGSIVGGKVISGEHQGRIMSSLTVQVLAGISTDILPVIATGANKFIFDSNILEKFNIKENKLPKDSIIINKTKTFYEKYTFLVQLTTLFIIILLLVIIILIINVEKRKESEKLLENQLYFQQVLIDNISIPIYYKNRQGLYLGCNSSFSEIFGIDKKSIAGKSVFDISPKDLAQVYFKADNKLMKERGYQEYITQIKTKNGELRDVVMQKNTFDDKDGNTAGIIGCYFDITEITNAKNRVEELNNNLEKLVDERTADLEKSNKKLQNTLVSLEKTQNTLIGSSKMASLGKLVASVAHEINTPIGLGVTGVSHFESETKSIEKLYKENYLGKEEFESYLHNSRQIAKTILSNLTKAAQIIKSFKNIAVDQSSEEKREFNVKEYIDDILLSLNHALKKTKHTINIECDKKININNYPGLFSQVFTNLIMNSIIHGFDDIEEGKINIKVSLKDNKNCHIIYKDNGKGLDEKTQKNICNPFYTTKKGEGGSGLGMNIVENIITKQLQGTLNIESKEGEYTKFNIIFPIN